MEKTVAKAFKLLETLAAHRQPRRISELGRETGLAKSNVHRLLRTLVELGYVQQRADGLYEPSMKIWGLGSRSPSHLALQRVANLHLKRLAAGTFEWVHLAILDHDDVIFLERIETDEQMRSQTVLNHRAPAHCVATGKAMLAYQPDVGVEALGKLLRAHTANATSSAERLAIELAQVRRQGFAINLGEWQTGIHAVAAPIAAADGRVSAAVSVAGSSDHLHAKRLRDLAPLVVECAKAISRDLVHGNTMADPMPPRRAAVTPRPPRRRAPALGTLDS